MEQREQIGLIGLGLMGSALAARLASAGYGLLGQDLDRARCRALQAAGGEVVPESASIFERCERIVLSLPDSEVVARVLDGVAEWLRPGLLVLDTTTGSPRDTADLGARLAGSGVAYLDATVSGSSAQVERGEVTVMVGGQPADFARAGDLLACFARRVFHLGPWGAGARMKLVSNLVLGLNRAALAEGLAFADALGLDSASALEVLRASMAYSRIMDTKGGKMVEGDFSVEARLSQHLKDVRLILAEADSAGLALPASETHRALLEAAEAAGYGDADNSAILRAYARRRCTGRG